MANIQGSKIQLIELIEWKPKHWRLFGEIAGVRFDIMNDDDNPKELLQMLVDAMTRVINS